MPNLEGILLNAYMHGAIEEIAKRGDIPLAVMAREAMHISQKDPKISMEEAIILAAKGEKNK